MAKRGRPTTLDDSTREQLLAAISDGMPIRRAATLVGTNHATVYRLASSNPGFSDALKKARSAFEAFHLRKIGRDESWQSSAWLLERIHHKRYAKREPKPQVEVQSEKTIKMRPLKGGTVRPKSDARNNVNPT